MSTTTASQSLADAWLDLAKRAAADLNHAAQAPALFRSEFVERRQADMETAVAWAAFWRSQEVGA